MQLTDREKQILNSVFGQELESQHRGDTTLSLQATQHLNEETASDDEYQEALSNLTKEIKALWTKLCG